jgi:hypothetical protein
MMMSKKFDPDDYVKKSYFINFFKYFICILLFLVVLFLVCVLANINRNIDPVTMAVYYIFIAIFSFVGATFIFVTIMNWGVKN